MNTQEQDANVIDVASIGRKAVELWKSSDRDGAKAEGLAIFALFQAHFTLTFEAVVTNKKGEVEEQESFDLAEYHAKPPKNVNGTKNIKLMAARTCAVMNKVFGIPQPTNADKQRLIRAMSAVNFLVQQGYDESQISLSKRNNLVVPFPVMNDAPADDAAENDKKRYAAMEGETWEIDGKQGNSLAELNRRAKPKIERAAQTPAQQDKGATFVASIKFVDATLQQLLDMEAADDMPAPTNDMRKALFELYARLGGYFEVDPMEDEQEEQKVA